MALLDAEHIYKSFKHTEVLKDISFSLEKGEVLAIIGSSGSGKTTLLRCLNFLERPDMGKILVNGSEIFNADDAELLKESAIRKNRLHFGMVFQQFNLFPQYTVLGNLCLAANLAAKRNNKEDYNPQESKAQIEKNALELLERVGLSQKKNAYPCELSGGQQQRVAIARALMLTPDILCFDEPTSALDPELTNEVLNVIRGLKSEDTTMIVVTHEMGFAKSVADRVIFMANGIIEEQGTPEEVFDNPKSPILKSFLSNAARMEES